MNKETQLKEEIEEDRAMLQTFFPSDENFENLSLFDILDELKDHKGTRSDFLRFENNKAELLGIQEGKQIQKQEIIKIIDEWYSNLNYGTTMTSFTNKDIKCIYEKDFEELKLEINKIMGKQLNNGNNGIPPKP